MKYSRFALGLVALVGCSPDRILSNPVVPEQIVTVAPAPPLIVINEILANPAAVADDVGEWFEVHNYGSTSVNLQNWRIVSGGETHTIAASVSVSAGGYAVLARNGSASKNGGVTEQYVYGTSITLANSTDWLALRDATGATMDSVAWTTGANGIATGVRDPSADNASVDGGNWQAQTSVFGKGDKGTPGARNNGYIAPAPVVTSVVVTPATASITVGATQQFTATATDAGGNPVSTTFTWTSSNPAAATVNGSGLATGTGAGTASITATAANGVAGSATLTVSSGGGGGGGSEVVVKVLDIGQGDGIYIANGTSKVFIDGGPDMAGFGQHLDALGLNNSTIDVVIVSHAHFDHYQGLRELFSSARNITIRYLFENKDASANTTLAALRDSINARVGRGQLIYRDSDDPCGTGADICTVIMNGGAKLHVMRPNPAGSTANNRSTPVKLVGPDSASFSMWFAGDAEHEAIDWFDATNYDVTPGMRVSVLKADHHGSCNGVKSRYVDLLNPEWVLFSVGSTNTYGHVHQQTKDLFTQYGRPWYRTDQNGTITLSSPGTPGGGYTVAVERGVASSSGPSDRTSAQTACSSL